jgi:hypothetical protein
MSRLVVLLVLVAPFVLVFLAKLALISALRLVGVELPGLGTEGPRIAGFFALFALGTTFTVPPVRRLLPRWADAATAALVASWYAGAAFVFLSGTRSFSNLMPVLVFTGVAVFVTIWWSLRQLTRERAASSPTAPAPASAPPSP